MGKREEHEGKSKREEGRGKSMKGRARGKRIERTKRTDYRNKTQEGWSPSPRMQSDSVHAYFVENWIPLSGFHVCPIVLIEAFSWAAVMAADLKGFSNFEVVR